MCFCEFYKSNKIDINPVYCVSLPGYTWQCGLKYTGIHLQILQDEDLNLELENIVREDTSSVMGDRCVKPDETKKIVYMVVTNLYVHSMIPRLLYEKIEMWHGHPDLYMNKLEQILYTSDDSDIGYFLEVDLRYPDSIKEKTKNFRLTPETKVFLAISIMIVWKR